MSSFESLDAMAAERMKRTTERMTAKPERQQRGERLMERLREEANHATVAHWRLMREAANALEVQATTIYEAEDHLEAQAVALREAEEREKLFRTWIEEQKAGADKEHARAEAVEEREARTLRVIADNAESFHKGEDGKEKALAVIAKWARDPSSIPAALTAHPPEQGDLCLCGKPKGHAQSERRAGLGGDTTCPS